MHCFYIVVVFAWRVYISLVEKLVPHLYIDIQDIHANLQLLRCRTSLEYLQDLSLCSGTKFTEDLTNLISYSGTLAKVARSIAVNEHPHLSAHACPIPKHRTREKSLSNADSSNVK